MQTFDARKLIGPLAVVSVLETVSFLVLLGAMALLDKGELRTMIGATHGMLFALYAVLLVLARSALEWSLGFIALGIFTGPIGAVVVLGRLRRRRAPAAAPAE